MHKSFSILALILALAPLEALAERSPQRMGQDARVRHVAYSASDVIRVDTNMRTNTAIELGSGERIGQVLLGDSEAFEVKVLSTRNTVSIKPLISKAATNMTIYTGRRVLSFYLTEGRSQTPTYRVVIDFPDRTAARPTRRSGPRDLGYEFSGQGQSRPIAVWNDGQSTFFEFRSDLRPSVFSIGPNGYERSVNSATRGRVVRVSGVHDAYTLRMGQEVICLRRKPGGAVSAAARVAALAQKEF